MAWLGLFAGVIVGALLWRMPGALALGFIGWLVGFIVGAQRKPVVPATPVIPVQTGIQGPERSVVARLDAIERRLAEIEARAGIVTTAPTMEEVVAPKRAPIAQPLTEPAPASEPQPSPAPAPK
ncbi:MAG: hypothetical protein H7Y14_11080, partial [Burkholderiales bacterium]|nr:hypothetical protein [Burkholderiales bacterium]